MSNFSSVIESIQDVSHDPEQLLADQARLQGEAQALRDELTEIFAKSLASPF